MEFHLARLKWLGRLRYVAFFVQLLLLGIAVSYYHLSIAVTPVVLALLAIPISQWVYSYRLKEQACAPRYLGVLLAFDVILLTTILYFSGGPTNPFSLVYLVLVVLSAVLVSKFWTWSIAVLSSLCFGFLFLYHTPIPELHHSDGHHELSLHLQGMLVSYVLIAGFVAYFLSRIIDEVKQNQARLEHLRINQERLTTMTTVTANAAHDLGTPLASLELISSEILRAINERSLNEQELMSDLNVLRSEVVRCRSIIDEMCSASGSVVGEDPSWTSPLVLVEEVIESLGAATKVAVIEPEDGDGTLVYLQRGPAHTALRILVNNALDATDVAQSDENVVVSWDFNTTGVAFEIRDHGIGMGVNVMGRLGEPFLTTKEPGEGMGLGIYIARLVAEQLGGSLKFYSTSDRGTSVRISFSARMSAEFNVAA